MASANYQVSTYTDSNKVTSPAFLTPPIGLTNGVGSPINPQLLIRNANAFTITSQQNASFQFLNSQTTIAATAWLADPASRTQLMNDFVAFVQAMEAGLELATPQLAPPGTAYAVGQSIADLMPCPVAESLFYRYSLSAGFGTLAFSKAYVDVRPGMVLRIDPEVFQVPGAKDVTGYSAAGSVRLRVSSIPNPQAGGNRLITFDPFLGAINPPTGPGGSAPQIASGAIDLCQLANLMPYVRLYYPASVTAITQPGSKNAANNPLLIAAPTLATMNTTVSNVAAPGTLSSVIFGRATVVPEIPIWIRSGGSAPGIAPSVQMEYVPVGSTLYHLLERVSPYPPSWGAASVGLQRRGSLISAPPGLSLPVGVDLATASLAPALDVPLIAGDVVIFGSKS